MLRMSTPYNENPQNQPDPNPYSQPTPNPYGQPEANPYSQPTPNPYDQPPAQYGGAGPAQYGGASPAQYGGASPVPYGQPYGSAPQEHPQGTLILIFGIIGIFSGIFAPIAWYLGNKARREIAASGASYANDSQISTGRMLGKVFTIIYIVSTVLFIIFFIILAVIGVSQSPR